MVVSNIFYFHPYLGKWSSLTNIFQTGWFNHHRQTTILRWLVLLFPSASWPCKIQGSGYRNVLPLFFFRSSTYKVGPYLFFNCSLSQWPNFKLFGITYWVGKIKFKLFFSGSIGWVRLDYNPYKSSSKSKNKRQKIGERHQEPNEPDPCPDATVARRRWPQK